HPPGAPIRKPPPELAETRASQGALWPSSGGDEVVPPPSPVGTPDGKPGPGLKGGRFSARVTGPQLLGKMHEGIGCPRRRARSGALPRGGRSSLGIPAPAL